MVASVVYVALVLAVFTAMGLQPSRPGGPPLPLRDRSSVLPTALAGLRRLQELYERGRLPHDPTNPLRHR